MSPLGRKACREGAKCMIRHSDGCGILFGNWTVEVDLGAIASLHMICGMSGVDGGRSPPFSGLTCDRDAPDADFGPPVRVVWDGFEKPGTKVEVSHCGWGRVRGDGDGGGRGENMMTIAGCSGAKWIGVTARNVELDGSI